MVLRLSSDLMFVLLLIRLTLPNMSIRSPCPALLTLFCLANFLSRQRYVTPLPTPFFEPRIGQFLAMIRLRSRKVAFLSSTQLEGLQHVA
jgi:hypothetical protein